MKFGLSSKFKPAGSQPKAIDELTKGIKSGKSDQVLLGVTGSGKTFTIANVIEKIKRPALVIAHNKTLAAQLTQEFREFFPDSAVEYFVSYYDYYQPEAYLPNTDTYIEKEATVNDEIDRLRNAATQAILSREDVIVVASVSCIYGLGSPEFYAANTMSFEKGQEITREDIMRRLISLQYKRSDIELARGTFHPTPKALEIIPADREVIYQVKFEEDSISEIAVLDKTSRSTIENLAPTPENQKFSGSECRHPKDRRSSDGSVNHLDLFPAKHYLVPPEVMGDALKEIEHDLEERLKYFRKSGKVIEAERLSRRTRYDMEMIREVGYCNGIENYSRYFDRRAPGSAPFTLVDYFATAFKNNYLLVIDESHVTVPQIRGMYEGDKSRKDSLIEYGFRLPAARDNRPLKFDEFEKKMPQTIYVSATPADYEKGRSAEAGEGNSGIIEQIVRPTGLVDPETEIRPTENQVENLILEIEKRTAQGERTLVTTLTKKMAEDLTGFLKDRKIQVRYLHSGVETLDRIRTLTDLRKGEFDVLVGVNLLREGLDLPEVSLVAILDADKEGFLRSETSLVQTIGRAARNVNGKVILYADFVTGSMKRALDETSRRRKIQLEYNIKHGITPKTIEKEIKSIVTDEMSLRAKRGNLILDPIEAELSEDDLPTLIKQKEREMKQAAQELRFEEAILIRDQLISLQKAGRFLKKAR